MGCCKGVCKALLILWTIIAMIFALGMLGFMAYKLEALPKQKENPSHIQNLLVELPGSGWYESLNIVKLNKYTWYAGLGLATLMFISTVIHMISTCRKSKCLFGLSTLLLILVMGADVTGLVFRFQAQNSIDARIEVSLNETIINKYDHADYGPLTKDWNTLGSEGACCGINHGNDFKLAKWIKESSEPCGIVLDVGCADTLRSLFITLNDIWFTSLIVVKVTLIFIILMHTCCVCKLGVHKDGGGTHDAESYVLVNR